MPNSAVSEPTDNQQLLQELPASLVQALENPKGLHCQVPPKRTSWGQALVLHQKLDSQDQTRAALLLSGDVTGHLSGADELIKTIFLARAADGAPPESAPITLHRLDTKPKWALAELTPGIWLTDQVAKNGRAPIPQAIQIIRLAAQSLAWWHNSKLLAGPVLPEEIWAPLDGKSAQFPWIGLCGPFLSPEWLASEAGTPYLPYTPPEILDGGPWDISADLYALGCLAYWLLTGELPYNASSAAALREVQRTKKPRTPPELRMGVPATLSELVMRLISTEAHERPLKAQPVADRLGVLATTSTGIGPSGDGYGVRTDMRGATPAPRPALSVMDEELQRLKAEVETKPDDPDAWLKLAQTQLRHARPGEAILSAEKALKLNPKMGAAALVRVDAMMARGDYKRALGDLQILAKALPNAPQIFLRLAKAHLASGNAPLALTDCDHALKSDPKNLEALTLRGKAHLVLGQHARALDDLDAALTIARTAKPAGVAKLLSMRGEINLLLNRHEETLADLEEALKADPNSSSARQVRIHYLLAVNKPVEAEADCDLLVNQSGRMAWPWLLRAKQRQMAGEYSLALEDLDQAMEIEATPHTMAHIALLLASAPEKSIRDPERALDLGRKAAEETGWDDPFVLEGVAAAYAACGQPETAAGWILKAITKGKPEDRERLQDMLKVFKAGKPFRLGK